MFQISQHLRNFRIQPRFFCRLGGRNDEESCTSGHYRTERGSAGSYTHRRFLKTSELIAPRANAGIRRYRPRFCS
jgi:hypothetical protein